MFKKFLVKNNFTSLQILFCLVVCCAGNFYPLTATAMPTCQVKQLSNQQVTPQQIPLRPFPGDDFADPSPPRLEKDGSVTLYGSGSEYLLYRSQNGRTGMQRLIAGEEPQIRRIQLAHPDGSLIDQGEEDEAPWDLSVQTWPQWGNKTVLYAGVMAPPPGKTNASFPDDNQSRRVYAFHQRGKLWKRDPKPLTASLTGNWLGHSYGHSFLTDDAGKVWLFYEKVSFEKHGAPWVTGIYAKEMLSPFRTAKKEHRILEYTDSVYDSASRWFGGTLVEGARPIRVQLGDETVYVISFSSGDFATNHYGINAAWSLKPLGPYQPILNSKEDDFLDLGSDIRSKYNLGWGPSRAAFFADETGEWHALFHAVRTVLWPDFNYDVWPEDFGNLSNFRDTFLTSASFAWTLNAQGKRALKIQLCKNANQNL